MLSAAALQAERKPALSEAMTEFEILARLGNAVLRDDASVCE
jgi:hypothetical protein